MSDDTGALVPRSGFGALPRLHAGPRVGQRSLYQQQVVDEDTYTDALSHIITRDFFPNLPEIHATNAYLTALTNNDPELLSASIRRLASIAQRKEEGVASHTNETFRRRELENVGTPYISIPGGKAPLRTPVGGRGWDTPVMRGGEGSTRRVALEAGYDELEGNLGLEAGPSRPSKRRKTLDPRRVRDDLSLDVFQHNYTSEDNASFVQIVEEENKQRREKWGWAWEAEEKAEQRRIEGEQRRKLLLEVATSGKWTVNGEGKRLMGGLAEGGSDKANGEAWDQPRRTINAIPEGPEQGDQEASNSKLVSGSTERALLPSTSSSGTLIKVPRPSQVSSAVFAEEAVPEGHPLYRALASAGLPPTALVSRTDGALIPLREVTTGGGDGRGRGDEERALRQTAERAIIGDEIAEHLSLGGSGGDLWGYKTRNNFMFPADANAQPYPVSLANPGPIGTARQAPREIKHANTRLTDEDEVGAATSTSRRGSSPARSWVAAAVSGTPYHPRGDSMPTVNNYPLLPNDPSPSPQDLPSLLTWGTLLSTPRALDGGDDPLDVSGPSFRIPDTKRRDELGRKLGDKASRSMNVRAKSFTPRSSASSLDIALRNASGKTEHSIRGEKTPGTMLPPSTPRRQADSLTPAAKRLLERSIHHSPISQSGKSGLGISTGGKNRGSAMEKGSGWTGLGSKKIGGREVGGMSWTPSPARGSK